MPSTERRWRRAGAVVAALALVYSFLITTAWLLGVLTAGLVYGAAWTVGRVGPDRLVARMGRRRAAVTALFGAAILVYGVVVAGRILLALDLALLLAFASWLTAPDGPLVRLVRWVLNARDDLREVREAIVADSRPSRDD